MMSTKADDSNHSRTNAVLNGVVGDYLDATGNELAVEMTLLDRNGVPVDVDLRRRRSDSANSATAAEVPSQTPDPLHSNNDKKKKICILVHGLTDDETTWSTSSSSLKKRKTSEDEDEAAGAAVKDYGLGLERDLDITPYYLRYNTGLHISTNGRKLDRVMEAFVTARCNSFVEEYEIIFICHSMGGLVTRSALHYSLQQQRSSSSSSNYCSSCCSWSRMAKHVVFLGTPHHGSIWERLGDAVATALGAVPRPYTKLASDVANLRSAGIKDLRHGYVLDEEWMESNNDDDEPDDDEGLWWWNDRKRKYRAHLPNWIAYYVITGTVTKNPNDFVTHCVGDALVRRDSARGRSTYRGRRLDDADDGEDHRHHLPFHEQSEFAGVKHWQLTNHPHVYHQIKEWVEKPWDGPPPPSPCVCRHSGDVPEFDMGDAGDDEDNCDDKNLRGSRRRSVWSERRGAAALAQDAVGGGVRAVEGVHKALTDETFDVLARVPTLTPLVRSIQAVHDASVFQLVYRSIHAISNGTGEAAKYVCDRMDERQLQAVPVDEQK